MTVAAFAGFQTLLVLNLGESRILQHFEWFSWNSGQNSQNFGEIHGFPVMLSKHFLQDFQCRPWGVCGYFLEQPILRESRAIFHSLFKYQLQKKLFPPLFQKNKCFVKFSRICGCHLIVAL